MTPEVVRNILNQNHVVITDSQFEKLLQWEVLFREWNQKINLISRQDAEHLWEHHVLHSLSLLTVCHILPGQLVCDLGTGGGLPGLLLAILKPDCQWVLMDARRKKVDAVKDMIEKLGLLKVQAVWGRAEDLGLTQPYRRRFPLMLARAVGSLEHIEQWTRLCRTTQSTLYVYKGGPLEAEIEALHKICPKAQVKVHPLQIEGDPQWQENDKKIVEIRISSK